MKKLKLAVVFILLLFTTLSFPQNATRDQDKERKIEDQLLALDFSAVQPFKDGTVAMDNGNLALADSLYSQVYEKAPTFDPVIRRLGSIKLQMGDTLAGINLCEKAVALNRSVYNLLSLAYCYYFPGTRQDLVKTLDLLKEARTLPGGDEMDVLALTGDAELQTGNVSEFKALTSTMQSKYPDQMTTHYYNAIVAANDKKWKEAKKEILLAEKTGLSHDSAQEFLNSGINSQVTRRNLASYFLWIVLIWAVGLLLLFIVGKILSNVTLKSIGKGNSMINNSNKKNFIRSAYKSLINIGGIYYYFSLPVILVLVVALVAGLFYVFLLAGRMPIKLMLLLLIGSVITIYSMIRSLFIKVKSTDPGRELKTEEAPGLFSLASKVAQTIVTRPIDEIRLTQGTDLAVYERGTWRQKIQDRAKRILILGAGVVKDFRQNDFRAVLAHEYGHFSHRDTAGGEVAIRVTNDMNKYIYALCIAGQNVWWNIAFQFLRLYDFIFRRISFGSTRLQEILADRVAAQNYGAAAFKNGLTYVLRRDIEFDDLAKQKVEEVKKAIPNSINIYSSSRSSSASIDEELDKALNRKTTEDDTHPSPADRFKFISNISTPSLPEDTSMVRDLFANWDSITKEMSEIIEKRIVQNI